MLHYVTEHYLYYMSLKGSFIRIQQFIGEDFIWKIAILSHKYNTDYCEDE